MPPRLSLRRLLAGLLLCAGSLLLPTLAPAQQRTDDATKDAAKPETPIELPPFEVRTDKDEGYLAQNTASGSRLNSNLNDIGAAISVFTAEFMADIGATNITELSNYMTNTNRVDGMVGDVANGNEFTINDTTFKIRGLSSSGRMVNFISRGSEVDAFNTERVELSRGPNAVLFGLGQAGGAFNVSTKKADLRRSIRNVSVRVGAYDAFRSTLDIGQPIIRDKLAIRINAATDRKESWRSNEFKDQDRLDVTARWKITPKTDLSLEYEVGHTEQSVQRMWASFDSFTLWNSLGRPLDTVAGAGVSPGTTNIGGIFETYESNSNRVWNLSNQSRSAQTPQPGTTDSTPTANPMLTDFSIVPREVTAGGTGVGNAMDQRFFTATLQHELLKNWFVEAAVNRQETSNLGRDIGNTEVRVQWDTSPTLPTTASTPASTPNPFAGKPFVEVLPVGRNNKPRIDDLRVTSSYEFNLGKLFGRHRIAGLYERVDTRTKNVMSLEKVVQNPLNPTSADNANNSLHRRTYVDLAGPVADIAVADFRTHSISGLIDLNRNVPVASAFVPQTVGDDDRVVDSRLFVAQSRFWKERLVTTLGYREDKVTTYAGTSLRGPAYGPFAQGDLYAIPGYTPAVKIGRTKIGGGVFHALPWLSLSYNHSTSFSPAGTNTRIARNEFAPSPVGMGDDYGLKFAFLGGKLFATVTYYQTAARNNNGGLNVQFSNDGLNAIWTGLQAAGVLAQKGIKIEDVQLNLNAYSFDSDSKGWEVELVANPTPNWRLLFNLSDDRTIQTNTAKELLDYVAQWRPLWNQYLTTPAGNITVAANLATFDNDALNRFIRPEGAIALGDSRYAMNLRTNYSFREGRLRGISSGLGVRWRAKPVLGYSSAEPATRQPYWGNDTLLADLNVSYRRQATWFKKRLDLTFQLNVNNLMNEDAIVPTRFFDNGQIRTYKFQNPRDWFVTTTMRF